MVPGSAAEATDQGFSGYGPYMNVIDFILLLLAAICFAVAALYGPRTVANPPYWGPALVPLGLFLWVLDYVIHAAQHLNGS